jgi:hypothetical protein
MKKLVSLNNSLFEKFEKNRVHNLAQCFGGEVKPTTTSLGNGKDGYDLATTNGSSGISLNGTFVTCDVYRGA